MNEPVYLFVALRCIANACEESPLLDLRPAALVEVDRDQQRLHAGRWPEARAVRPRGPRLRLDRGGRPCAAQWELRSVANTSGAAEQCSAEGTGQVPIRAGLNRSRAKL